MGTAKPHHPLIELLGRLLLGIEIVPKDEQRRMVNRVCKEAVLWHEAEVKRLREYIHALEALVDWYEVDQDRVNFEDEEVPADLRALEDKRQSTEALAANEGQKGGGA